MSFILNLEENLLAESLLWSGDKKNLKIKHYRERGNKNRPRSELQPKSLFRSGRTKMHYWRGSCRSGKEEVVAIVVYINIIQYFYINRWLSEWEFLEKSDFLSYLKKKIMNAKEREISLKCISTIYLSCTMSLNLYFIFFIFLS